MRHLRHACTLAILAACGGDDGSAVIDAAAGDDGVLLLARRPR